MHISIYIRRIIQTLSNKGNITPRRGNLFDSVELHFVTIQPDGNASGKVRTTCYGALKVQFKLPLRGASFIVRLRTRGVASLAIGLK